MIFGYIKIFLAVMFGWLLYATLVEFTASANSLVRTKTLTYMDDNIGERVLEWGKDTRRIVLFLLQHILIAAVFGFAIYLMIG